MKPNVQVIGVTDAQAKMRRFGSGTEVKLKRRVALGAINIERVAKQLCAVRTGRLRSSIGIRFSSDGWAATVGTNVQYGPVIEMGGHGRPARPYLYPAWDAERVLMVRDIKSIVVSEAR